MHTIQDENFRVWYDQNHDTVMFEGFLQLPSLADYAPITSILDESLLGSLTHLTVNLCKLEFLNSSGISTLSRFVVKARHQKTVHLCFQGNSHILWQSRSLKNLKRLMPNLSLEWQ